MRKYNPDCTGGIIVNSKYSASMDKYKKRHNKEKGRWIAKANYLPFSLYDDAFCFISKLNN